MTPTAMTAGASRAGRPPGASRPAAPRPHRRQLRQAEKLVAARRRDLQAAKARLDHWQQQQEHSTGLRGFTRSRRQQHHHAVHQTQFQTGVVEQQAQRLDAARREHQELLRQQVRGAAFDQENQWRHDRIAASNTDSSFTGPKQSSTPPETAIPLPTANAGSKRPDKPSSTRSRPSPSGPYLAGNTSRSTGSPTLCRPWPNWTEPSDKRLRRRPCPSWSGSCRTDTGPTPLKRHPLPAHAPRTALPDRGPLHRHRAVARLAPEEFTASQLPRAMMARCLPPQRVPPIVIYTYIRDRRCPTHPRMTRR